MSKKTRRNSRKNASNRAKYTRKLDKQNGKSKYTFDMDELSSGDGMLTSVWGPSLWHYLHTMSFNYPVKPTTLHKKKYMEFIKNLQHTLPCVYCRINLKNNFKDMPLLMCHMKSRKTFSTYVYELHEKVNHMLGKKSNLSYMDVCQRYENFRARCNKSKMEKKIWNKTKKQSKTKKEKGCVEPYYGKKSKCIIKIVPQDGINNKSNSDTFQMDKRCYRHK